MAPEGVVQIQLPEIFAPNKVFNDVEPRDIYIGSLHRDLYDNYIQ
jgi:hypothetical protein